LRVETDIIENARDLGAVLDHEKPLLRPAPQNGR
jgi:hypothetical protein